MTIRLFVLVVCVAVFSFSIRGQEKDDKEKPRDDDDREITAVSVAQSWPVFSPPVRGSDAVTGVFRFRPRENEDDGNANTVVLRMTATIAQTRGAVVSVVRVLTAETSAVRAPHDPEIKTASLTVNFDGTSPKTSECGFV